MSNPLAEPLLELHDASGSALAANDDWQDSQADQITATGLARAEPNESAIYATLPAGSYTAVYAGRMTRLGSRWSRFTASGSKDGRFQWSFSGERTRSPEENLSASICAIGEICGYSSPTCGLVTRMNYSTRHLHFGWWALSVYVSLGIGLETMHGFKIGWYLDVGNEVRRLMFTLGHFHGTMLALVNIAAGLTIRNVDQIKLRRSTSWALIWAAILLPGGFLSGGFWTYDGDPGSGVWLVPAGALCMLYGVITFALGLKAAPATPARRGKKT